MLLNKTWKNLLSKKISHLSPGSLAPVRKLYIRIYLRIFFKAQNGSYRVFRAMGARIFAWEKLICEKPEAENLVSDSLNLT